MSAEATASLFDRRIVIVTGKGGTGKTTVSAALGLAAADRGLQVLIAEVGPFEQIPALLGGPDVELVGYAGRELRPGLHVMRIDPFAAVAEYIGMQIGSRRLVERALATRGLKQLLDGAPGWRELITLGKTWQLEQMRTATGAPRYDLIVMDAPATGHGLTFLDVPHVVRSAVRGGPLARNAEKVEALIRDPARTLVLPVSLAEELPTQETSELVARVREDLEMCMDRVVVNAVSPPPPVDDPDTLRDVLGDVATELALERLPSPPELARSVDHLTSRHRLNAHYVGEIASRTGLPSVPLPLIAGGVAGPEALRRLAEPLLVAPDRSGRPTGPTERCA
jgi:anion-transporting  ArsA/GET3 family ATPase